MVTVRGIRFIRNYPPPQRAWLQTVPAGIPCNISFYGRTAEAATLPDTHRMDMVRRETHSPSTRAGGCRSPQSRVPSSPMCRQVCCSLTPSCSSADVASRLWSETRRGRCVQSRRGVRTWSTRVVGRVPRPRRWMAVRTGSQGPGLGRQRDIVAQHFGEFLLVESKGGVRSWYFS